MVRSRMLTLLGILDHLPSSLDVPHEHTGTTIVQNTVYWKFFLNAVWTTWYSYMCRVWPKLCQSRHSIQTLFKTYRHRRAEGLTLWRHKWANIWPINRDIQHTTYIILHQKRWITLFILFILFTFHSGFNHTLRTRKKYVLNVTDIFYYQYTIKMCMCHGKITIMDIMENYEKQ